MEGESITSFGPFTTIHTAAELQVLPAERVVRANDRDEAGARCRPFSVRDSARGGTKAGPSR